MDPDPNTVRPADDAAPDDPVADDLMRAPRAGIDPELDPDPALYVPTVADAPTTPGEGPFPAEARDREERLRGDAGADDPSLHQGDVEPLDRDQVGGTDGEVVGGVGGALMGGAIGAIVGGPVGAVAGGVIGAGAGAVAGRAAEDAHPHPVTPDDTSGLDATSSVAADSDEAVIDHGRRTVERVDPVDPDDVPRPGAPGPLVLDDDAEARELDDPDDPHLPEDRELNP